MKVLICPDSFKGTLTAIEVSEIIGDVLSKKSLDTIIKPIADGGDGTIDVIEYSSGGTRYFNEVINPLRKQIRTYYLALNDTAYIEFAKSSGISLINQNELNPFISTSYGFGELIKDAICKGFKNIYLALGGSATNDAGVGMLQALGVKFFDNKNQDITYGNKLFLDASSLKNIYNINVEGLRRKIKDINFKVLSDVKNPLTGKNGATYVFGKQKGANSNMLKELENGIIHFSGIVREIFSKEMNFPGAGAAGGACSSAKIFLNAEVVSGIEEIIKILEIENNIINSDIVIVGEGAMDYQTSFGKAPIGLAKTAKKFGKKVIGIAGKVGKNAEELLNNGIDCIFSSYGDVDIDIDVVSRNAKENLIKLSKILADTIAKNKISRNITIINK
jgi:glycerate kinase